jgi:pimeloyl-ACP methyl ester carboxylesterase
MGEIGPGVFSGKTLFVRGDKSDYILDADIPRMKESFPQMQLETIEHAGHWLHAEQPRALMELLLHFLGN